MISIVARTSLATFVFAINSSRATRSALVFLWMSSLSFVVTMLLVAIEM